MVAAEKPLWPGRMDAVMPTLASLGALAASVDSPANSAWQGAARAAAARFGEVRYDGTSLLGLLVAIVVVSLLVHMAARIVLDHGGFLQAIGTVVLGFLLAGLVQYLLPGLLGTILGLVVWAIVAAAFYRTSWLKAAVIGIVAYVIGLLVVFLWALLLRL